MLTVKKVEVWQTSDGVTHTSKAMADQYVLNAEMVSELTIAGYGADEAQDIINFLSGRRRGLVNDWLNACENLEKEILK